MRALVMLWLIVCVEQSSRLGFLKRQETIDHLKQEIARAKQQREAQLKRHSATLKRYVSRKSPKQRTLANIARIRGRAGAASQVESNVLVVGMQTLGDRGKAAFVEGLLRVLCPTGQPGKNCEWNPQEKVEIESVATVHQAQAIYGRAACVVTCFVSWNSCGVSVAKKQQKFVDLMMKLFSSENQGLEIANAMTQAGLPETALTLQSNPIVHTQDPLSCPTWSPTQSPTLYPTRAPTLVQTMLPHRQDLVKINGTLKDLGRAHSGSSTIGESIWKDNSAQAIGLPVRRIRITKAMHRTGSRGGAGGQALYLVKKAHAAAQEEAVKKATLRLERAIKGEKEAQKAVAVAARASKQTQILLTRLQQQVGKEQLGEMSLQQHAGKKALVAELTNQLHQLQQLQSQETAEQKDEDAKKAQMKVAQAQVQELRATERKMAKRSAAADRDADTANVRNRKLPAPLAHAVAWTLPTPHPSPVPTVRGWRYQNLAAGDNHVGPAPTPNSRQAWKLLAKTRGDCEVQHNVGHMCNVYSVQLAEFSCKMTPGCVFFVWAGDGLVASQPLFAHCMWMCSNLPPTYPTLGQDWVVGVKQSFLFKAIATPPPLPVPPSGAGDLDLSMLPHQRNAEFSPTITSSEVSESSELQALQEKADAAQAALKAIELGVPASKIPAIEASAAAAFTERHPVANDFPTLGTQQLALPSEGLSLVLLRPFTVVAQGRGFCRHGLLHTWHAGSGGDAELLVQEGGGENVQTVADCQNRCRVNYFCSYIAWDCEGGSVVRSCTCMHFEGDCNDIQGSGFTVYKKPLKNDATQQEHAVQPAVGASAPTHAPTPITLTPTPHPSLVPTAAPTTSAPSNAPTASPTRIPTTNSPSATPSFSPTLIPTTTGPTATPTPSPTAPTPAPTPAPVPLSWLAGLTLPNRHSNVQALASDDCCIYVGTNTVVMVVSKATMQIIGSTGTGYHNQITALAVDQESSTCCVYVVAADQQSNYMIVRMTKAPLTVTSSFPFSKDQSVPYALLLVGEHLFAGMYAYPAKVIKINKHTMQQVQVLELEPGENDVRWLVADKHFLYAFTNTAPGKVVKIQANTLRRISVLTLAPGQDHPLSGCGGYSDAGTNALGVPDHFIYIGTNTNPGTIVKVNLLSLHIERSCTLLPGEAYVVGLIGDTQYVYASTYTSPAKIIRIRKRDMKRMAVLTLGQGENQASAIVAGHAHMYVGTDTNPGKLVRIGGYRWW